MRDVFWILTVAAALTSGITALFGYLRLRIAQKIRNDHDRESMESFLDRSQPQQRGRNPDR